MSDTHAPGSGIGQPDFVTMRVHRPPAAGAGQPLLRATGPAVLLGDEAAFAAAVSPNPHALFGPRGACLIAPDGPLYVADTGHHRVLGYRRAPQQDNVDADFVLGQPDFTSEGRNALGPCTASTFNVPTAIAPYGERGLMVADAWNNRVLIWHERPMVSHTPADLVLGQADFSGMDPNRGHNRTAADRLHWPFAAVTHSGRLYVADAGNRRILVWRSLPTHNGQPADFALGQPHLEERSDNGGGDACAGSMRYPHGLCVWQGNLVVSDAGNNRVLIWQGLPDEGNAPAERVLGQANFTSVDHNRSSYWPNATCFNMPYSVAAAGSLLLVADTANSRLLGFEENALPENGAPAQRLTGQPTFAHKGDNRWQPKEPDSLCWPYGITVCEGTAVIADSGNNRVHLWPIALADG